MPAGKRKREATIPPTSVQCRPCTVLLDRDEVLRYYNRASAVLSQISSPATFSQGLRKCVVSQSRSRVPQVRDQTSKTALPHVPTPAAMSHVSTPADKSDALTPADKSHALTPAAMSHVSTPAAMSHVSTPAAMSHVSTPAVMSHVSTPADKSHALTPAAMSHVSTATPAATSHVSIPAATLHVSTSTAMSHVSTPAATSHVSTPAATSHVSTPTAMSHVSTPAVMSHVSTATPAAMSHVSTPAATSHVSIPAVMSHVSTPAAMSHVSSPAATSHVSIPAAMSYVSTPTAMSHASTPAALSQVSTPADKSDSTDASQEQLFTVNKFHINHIPSGTTCSRDRVNNGMTWADGVNVSSTDNDTNDDPLLCVLCQQVLYGEVEMTLHMNLHREFKLDCVSIPNNRIYDIYDEHLQVTSEICNGKVLYKCKILTSGENTRKFNDFLKKFSCCLNGYETLYIHCPNCAQDINCQRYFKVHLKTCFRNNQIYLCPFCFNDESNLVDILFHLKTHFLRKMVAMKCKICNKEYLHEVNLHYHTTGCHSRKYINKTEALVLEREVINDEERIKIRRKVKDVITSITESNIAMVGVCIRFGRSTLPQTDDISKIRTCKAAFNCFLEKLKTNMSIATILMNTSKASKFIKTQSVNNNTNEIIKINYAKPCSPSPKEIIKVNYTKPCSPSPKQIVKLNYVKPCSPSPKEFPLEIYQKILEARRREVDGLAEIGAGSATLMEKVMIIGSPLNKSEFLDEDDDMCSSVDTFSYAQSKNSNKNNCNKKSNEDNIVIACQLKGEVTDILRQDAENMNEDCEGEIKHEEIMIDETNTYPAMNEHFMKHEVTEFHEENYLQVDNNCEEQIRAEHSVCHTRSQEILSKIKEENDNENQNFQLDNTKIDPFAIGQEPDQVFQLLRRALTLTKSHQCGTYDEISQVGQNRSVSDPLSITSETTRSDKEIVILSDCNKHDKVYTPNLNHILKSVNTFEYITSNIPINMRTVCTENLPHNMEGMDKNKNCIQIYHESDTDSPLPRITAKKRRMQIVASSTFVTERSYIHCFMCAQVFSVSDYFGEHLDECYQNNHFTCPLCGKLKHAINESFVGHVMQHMRNMQPPNICDKCNFLFYGSHNFKLHYFTHYTL